MRRLLVGAVGGVLIAMAWAPAAAQAAEVPEITSISPAACSTSCKAIIRGENFEEVLAVHWGAVALKIISAGTVTKGECKVKSTTEIECFAPAYELGAVSVTVTNGAGTSPPFPGGVPPSRVYRNETPIGSAHVSVLGYGEMNLTSPQVGIEVECISLGFGSAWNGGPPGGHGEILVWWAGGHVPTVEHTELSQRCRIHVSPLEERPAAASGAATAFNAWVSAEPELRLVDQEAIVCAERTERFLHECASESEQLHEAVVREITREGLTLPWNIAFTEREGHARTVIGLPFECRGATGPEGTELSRCPEPSERQVGPASGCNVQPPPAPAGCVRIGVYSTPGLNMHMHFEGYVEPLNVNAGPNGLSPSTWEFEGHTKGEPTLHVRETPTSEGSLTGSLKILGYSGQELLTVR